MTEFLSLLTKLVEAPGVPGFEDPVIEIILEEIRPFVDSVEVDRLGNIVATKRGSSAGAPRIMLDAHIDEPGMVVKYVEPSGFIRVEKQGFPHSLALPSQRVVIHTKRGPVKGVFGVKGIHYLFSEAGISTPPAALPPLRDMYIDVGCDSAAEVASLGVAVGDPITLDSKLDLLGSGKLVVGKAFDNRALVAVLVETMRRLSKTEHGPTVYALASTMEELGLRGARGAANRIKPDLFIALDITVPGDTPDSETRDFPTRVGRGPVITIADMIWTLGPLGMTAHPAILEHLIRTAKEERIPYQVEAIVGAVTNASMMHEVGEGIPSAAVKVATRYSHTGSEVVSLEDLENTTRLLEAAIRSIGPTFSLARPWKRT